MPSKYAYCFVKFMEKVLSTLTCNGLDYIVPNFNEVRNKKKNEEMEKKIDKKIAKLVDESDLQPWERAEIIGIMEDAISNCSTVIFGELG